jgi:unsaturated rhamnogalacturonyl hydrolase
MGWYAMALVDMLEDIPPSHPGYPRLLDLLRTVVHGLASVQDPQTGLWYQVLDKGGQPGNWHETSGSGMIIYAIKMAVVRGYVDSSYLQVAQAGWAGLQAKIVVDPAGLPLITDAVEGMGPQVDYAAHMNKLHYANSTHGLIAIQLAAVAMEHY